MRTFLLSLACGVTLACQPREKQCGDALDDDGDGWIDCFDQDCADTCGELCGNLIDDNKDGTVDCDDPLCTEACTTYPSSGPEECTNGIDDDGDWLVDCQDDACDGLCDTDRDGFIDVANGGPDCDDERDDVYPGALEVPYNGTDEDCDPLTPDDDVDGDGFLLAADCGGTADDDAQTYPGAPEVCGDHVLNDCTNDSPPPRDYCYGDRPASTADATLYGSSAAGLAGWAVALGDLNDDGQGDVVIGAYGDGNDNTGAGYLVYGPLEGEIDLAEVSHKWLGESPDGWAGFAIAAGSDVTGDGFGDVAIGSRYDDQGGNNAGAVVVVEGAGVGTSALADEDRKLVGELQYDYAGSAVAMPGDVDGDGFEDLFIGAPNNSRFRTSAGVAHLVRGPITGPVQLALVDWDFLGEAIDDNAGCSVARTGDLDGDGNGDLLIGVCLNDRGGDDGGAAVQLSNYEAGVWSFDAADGALIAEAANDGLGSALAGDGDVDGDGLRDLLIGAPYHDGNGEDAGAAYLCTGPATASMNRPDAELVGETAGDKAGQSVAIVGDIDGDTLDDVAIGAPYSDLGGEDAGVAYVLFGPLDGEIDLAEADIRIIGAANYDFLGQSVAGGTDVNGDGFPDLLVGSPYNDTKEAAAGATTLFTFEW